MESGCSNGWKLGGSKLIRNQGREIIFSVYSFMKMEAGQEIDNLCRTDMGFNEDFITTRNVSFGVNGV
jgi:hypothetical protein